MKYKITVLICALFICLCSVTTPLSLAAEPATEIAQTQHKAEESTSKGAKIAGFLIIFTAAMGTTAFIVARPKLKKLKEIKKQSKK